MAGRCGCTAGVGGCGCCFTSTGSSVSLAGTGGSGSCITASVIYSADDNNQAHAGTDGGLFVPPASIDGGTITLHSEQTLVDGDEDSGSALVDGVGASIVLPDSAIVINNTGSGVAKALLIVHQRLLLTVDNPGSGSILGDFTLTATGDIDPSGTLVDFAAYHYEVTPQPSGDASIRTSVEASLAIPILAGGTVSVAVATTAVAHTDGAAGNATLEARTYSLILVGS